MKMGKKLLAVLLAVMLVATAGTALMTSAEETPGATHFNDFYDGSLFKAIAEAGDEAIVEANNVDQAAVWVENRGNKGVLFAGVLKTDPEDPMNKLKEVAPENRHEGYFIYKLNVVKGTKNLNVGMFYYTQGEFSETVKVYVSKTATFGDTPAAEFGKDVDNYVAAVKQMDISALDATTVYVKVVIPYANVREEGGNRTVDLGIEAIFVTPEVTKALHTNDTTPGSTAAGEPIVNADLANSMKDGCRDPWSMGLYAVSPKDDAKKLTPPMFRSDEKGLLPSEGGAGLDPKYVEFYYKVNTVSAMEGAKITVTGSVSQESTDGQYAYLDISYSKDGENWTEGVRKSGNELGSRWTGDLVLDLDAAAIGEGVDTLYAKVTCYKVSWPNWAFVKGVKIETTGANPAAEPDKPAEDPDKPAEDPDKPAEDPDKPAEDPDKPAEDPDKPAAEPGNADADPGASPDTGDVVCVTAMLLLAASASGTVLFRKRK